MKKIVSTLFIAVVFYLVGCPMFNGSNSFSTLTSGPAVYSDTKRHWKTFTYRNETFFYDPSTKTYYAPKTENMTTEYHEAGTCPLESECLKNDYGDTIPFKPMGFKYQRFHDNDRSRTLTFEKENKILREMH